MEQVLDNFFKTATNKQSLVYTFVSLAVAVYGGMSVGKPPAVIEEAFKQQWFRIIVLSLISYNAVSDPATAIMSAIGFTMVMNQLKQIQPF